MADAKFMITEQVTRSWILADKPTYFYSLLWMGQLVFRASQAPYEDGITHDEMIKINQDGYGMAQEAREMIDQYRAIGHKFPDMEKALGNLERALTLLDTRLATIPIEQVEDPAPDVQ